jgi:hypothetical protein
VIRCVADGAYEADVPDQLEGALEGRERGVHHLQEQRASSPSHEAFRISRSARPTRLVS